MKTDEAENELLASDAYHPLNGREPHEELICLHEKSGNRIILFPQFSIEIDFDLKLTCREESSEAEGIHEVQLYCAGLSTFKSETM